jgi:ChaC-like protein
VTTAVGFSGPNFEYVTKLADFVRNNIPQDTDQHLFELDSKIRQLLTSTPRDVKVNNNNNSGVADFVEDSVSRHVHEKNGVDKKKTGSVLLNFVSSQTPVISIRACNVSYTVGLSVGPSVEMQPDPVLELINLVVGTKNVLDSFKKFRVHLPVARTVR